MIFFTVVIPQVMGIWSRARLKVDIKDLLNAQNDSVCIWLTCLLCSCRNSHMNLLTSISITCSFVLRPSFINRNGDGEFCCVWYWILSIACLFSLSEARTWGYGSKDKPHEICSTKEHFVHNRSLIMCNARLKKIHGKLFVSKLMSSPAYR